MHAKPISFHKFWQIDPFEIYEQWLDGVPAWRPSAEYCAKSSNKVQQHICREHNEN